MPLLPRPTHGFDIGKQYFKPFLKKYTFSKARLLSHGKTLSIKCPFPLKKLNYGPMCTTASFTFPLGTENEKREEVTLPPSPIPQDRTDQRGKFSFFSPAKKCMGQRKGFSPRLVTPVVNWAFLLDQSASILHSHKFRVRNLLRPLRRSKDPPTAPSRHLPRLGRLLSKTGTIFRG